jgi:hypothetical protein
MAIQTRHPLVAGAAAMLIVGGLLLTPADAASTAGTPAQGTPAASDGGTDADELARKATDPTASLKAYSFLLSHVNGFHGPSNGEPDDQTTLKLQPVIPFAALGHPNILRMTLPYQIGGRGEEGFSVITVFDLIVFSESWGRWGVGPVMTYDFTGDAADRFTLGPAIGGVRQFSKKFSAGVFNQNVFGGDTAVSQLQPIIAYQLGDGWSLSAGDLQFIYDWKSSRWINAPIGFQLGKVAKLGKLPVRYAVNPQYNLLDDPGLPKASITFTFTALFP